MYSEVKSLLDLFNDQEYEEALKTVLKWLNQDNTSCAYSSPIALKYIDGWKFLVKSDFDSIEDIGKVQDIRYLDYLIPYALYAKNFGIFKKIILNLTLKPITDKDRKEGIVDLPKYLLERLEKTLTFNLPLSRDEILEKVETITYLVLNNNLNDKGLKNPIPYGVLIESDECLTNPLSNKLEEKGIITFVPSKEENISNKNKKFIYFNGTKFVQLIE